MKKSIKFLIPSLLVVGLIVPQLVSADIEKTQRTQGDCFMNQQGEFQGQGKGMGQGMKSCPDALEAHQAVRNAFQALQDGSGTEEEVTAAAQNAAEVMLDCKIANLSERITRVSENENIEDPDAVISIIESTISELEGLRSEIAGAESQEDMQAVRELNREIMETMRGELKNYLPERPEGFGQGMKNGGNGQKQGQGSGQKLGSQNNG